MPAAAALLRKTFQLMHGVMCEKAGDDGNNNVLSATDCKQNPLITSRHFTSLHFPSAGSIELASQQGRDFDIRDYLIASCCCRQREGGKDDAAAAAAAAAQWPFPSSAVAS